MASKKIPYVLVVIDMQPDFANTAEPIVHKCMEVITQAKDDKAFVLFVEYWGLRQTYTDLTEMCKKYKHASAITKRADDGSFEINKFLLDNELANKPLRVCGVNYEYCVHDTIIGLKRKDPSKEITLSLDAVNGRWQMKEGSWHLDNFQRASRRYEDYGVNLVGTLEFIGHNKSMVGT